MVNIEIQHFLFFFQKQESFLL